MPAPVATRHSGTHSATRRHGRLAVDLHRPDLPLGGTTIDTALYLADHLEHSGVHRVHVVPDPEIAPVLNALRLRGVTIEPALDPCAAAMLAAAESAVGSGTGVVVSGAGPSAAAIAPAAAQAQLERRALIVVTIEPNGTQARTSARRALDLRGLFASVSKGSYRLTSENARELVPLAWRLATTHPRGAVHLRVQADEFTRPAPPARAQTLSGPPVAPDDQGSQLQRASALIAGAHHILVLVGPEAIEARAETAARLLAQQWDAPVVVTPMAKGAVPETDPAFAGVLGGLGDHAVVELIEQSDLVVGFGVSSADFVRPWRTSVPTMHLSQSAGADPGFAAEVALVGPLNALANDLPRQSGSPSGGEALAAQTRRRIQDWAERSSGEPSAVTPQKVVAEMRRLASSDVPLAVETDAAGLLAAQLWSVTAPGTFHISNGLGLPGAGLALAVAAARLRPGAATCWIGLDASILARSHLLDHLRGIEASVPLVVIDQSLCVALVEAQESAGYPRVASDYASPNFEALAGTYSLDYTRVRSTDDLTSALAAALTAGHPTLVDVVGDRDLWWRIS